MIPKQLQAGDTISWTESLSEYPAPTWTLKYQLSGANNILLTAAADGADHVFTVSASTSASYHPGFYTYQKFVVSGSTSYTLGTGKIQILTDFRALPAGHEARSHVKVVLDALEAVIEGRATKSQESISIAGRAISYLSPAQLRTEYLHYKRLYESELAADRLNSGLSSGRKIVVRMVEPA